MFWSSGARRHARRPGVASRCTGKRYVKPRNANVTPGALPALPAVAADAKGLTQRGRRSNNNDRRAARKRKETAARPPAPPAHLA